MKLSLCVALASFVAVDAIKTHQHLRFLKQVAAQTAEHPAGSGELASQLPMITGNQASQYTYGAPNGNGANDRSSPLYGSYSHNYGPVNQLLSSTSGYGGFPSSIDPRGFNAQTQNFTAGAIQLPEGSPNQKGSAAQGLFTPANIAGAPMPGVSPGAGYMWGAGAQGSPYGTGPLGATGAMFAGMPVAGHPFLNSGMHVVPTTGAVSGTIPTVYPNGQMNGVATHPVVNTAMNMMAGMTGMRNQLNGGPYPATPTQIGYLPTAGSPYPGLASPLNPSYQANTMLHHQLTMGGSTFGAPGFFHPTSQSYPSPDADSYNSVARNPVLPPNFGKETPAAAPKK